jgi:hypothetical protein
MLSYNGVSGTNTQHYQQFEPLAILLGDVVFEEILDTAKDCVNIPKDERYCTLYTRQGTLDRLP